MPTVAEIIEIAQVSQYLSANAIRRGGLYSNGIDRRMPRLLYMVRKTVELRYEQDSADDTLPSTSSYLYALCGRFSLEAQRLLNIGGGGSVSPITPAQTNSSLYPIYITADELDEDGNYVNNDIIGDNLIVFFNDNDEKWHRAGADWFQYTPTGIQITAAYDETYTWVIDKLGTGDVPDEILSIVNYNLTENTEISNVTGTTDNQQLTIAIKPNGFSYTWASGFVFSDNWPEQPGAIAENTIQLYRFTYSAAISKWICSGQSINVPI